MLKTTVIESKAAPAAAGNYAQAVAIKGHERILYISGQIPADREGRVPASFADQCRLVWHNIEAQLRAADMTLANLVKVTTYLSDRKFREENSQIRQDLLRGVSPALTIIITGIYDEAWLLEIEAIAAS